MRNISARGNEWDGVLATAERNADIWATVGIHPHEGDAHPAVDTAKLKARAGHPKIVGIGETGLDYYYDLSDREQQQGSFRDHIAAALERGLTTDVHTRATEADVEGIVEGAIE